MSLSRRFKDWATATVFLAALAAVAIVAPMRQASAQAAKPAPLPAHETTNAQVEQWTKDLSNWGRWGPNDQLGAMNLITPQTRRAAFALVKEAYPVSLAHNFTPDAKNDNTSPFMHLMFGAGGPGPFVSDRYAFTYHGPDQSHFDALCHMSYQGKMYNGIPKSEVTRAGCNKLSVTDTKQGIAVRAVLIDIPRLKGVDYLQRGTPIYTEDVLAWEKMAHVKVRAGDMILLRTGRWAQPPLKAGEAESGAGFHVSVMPWLKSRDVALIGSDYATDVVPSGIKENSLPDHQLLLVAMGVHIFDNLDLEAISRECARRKQWAFLVTSAPLPVDLGTGSPNNPIAYF